jgi:hypothetical protein
MSNGPRSTDPQWAPDPTGLHAFRFWDGDQWSDAVSDDGVPPAYLPDAGPPQPPPTPTAAPVEAEHGTRAELSALRRQQERTHTKRWFWLGALMGACAVAAAIAVAVFVFNADIHRPSTTKRATVTKTTTTQKPTTTTTALPGRPSAQVHLDILNGAGVAKAAGTKALQLAALGYQIASVGNTTDRQGTSVACKPGFDLEAATLAKNVAPGTTVIAFPTPAPAGSSSADCVVLLGHAPGT